MILSEEKISHLAHLVLRALNQSQAFVPSQETEVLREIKRVILKDLQINEAADAAVRKKLDSYSKRLVEGSPEWQILYGKFIEEEIRKRKKEG